MSAEPHITLELDKMNNDGGTGSNMKQQHANNVIHSDVDTIDGKNLRIPRAVPETEEDDENDDRPFSADGHGGIDDGLLNPTSTAAARPRRPSFGFPGYDGPGFVDIDGVQTQIPDVNAYQHKKTLAQGMMDLALLSANANQLRYILETYRRHPYYYPSLIFISLSIMFQVAVGVGLIWNGRYNIKDEKEICRANKINNYTVIGIFVITVVNVFISAFGVADPLPDT